MNEKLEYDKKLAFTGIFKRNNLIERIIIYSLFLVFLFALITVCMDSDVSGKFFFNILTKKVFSFAFAFYIAALIGTMYKSLIDDLLNIFDVVFNRQKKYEGKISDIYNINYDLWFGKHCGGKEITIFKNGKNISLYTFDPLTESIKKEDEDQITDVNIGFEDTIECIYLKHSRLIVGLKILPESSLDSYREFEDDIYFDEKTLGQKACIYLAYIIFFMTALYPVGMTWLNYFGYIISLVSIKFFAISLVFLHIILFILLKKEEMIYKSKFISVLFAILTPVATLNAIFYVVVDKDILVYICGLIFVAFSLFLTVRFAKPKVFKIISVIISAVMIVRMVFLGFLIVIFGDFGKTTVVDTITSTNKSYYAEVIDDDRGALGGNTFVNVFENKKMDFLIFKIYKRPITVHTGPWEEYKTMSIYWKNDHVIVIDSTEYDIGNIK